MNVSFLYLFLMASMVLPVSCLLRSNGLPPMASNRLRPRNRYFRQQGTHPATSVSNDVNFHLPSIVKSSLRVIGRASIGSLPSKTCPLRTPVPTLTAVPNPADTSKKAPSKEFIYLSSVIGGTPLRTTKANVFDSNFNIDSFIGDTTFLFTMVKATYDTTLDKPEYLGMLKGRGTGKTTMCEALRHVCTENNILPISINFKAADGDNWLCVGVIDNANKIKFGLAVASRIFHDRFQIGLREVQALMRANYIDGMDEEILIQEALKLARAVPNGDAIPKAMVIVDESQVAIETWPVDGSRRLLSTLNAATIHNYRSDDMNLRGVSLFISSLTSEAFEADKTKSRLIPLHVDPLDPVEIRDTWLKLKTIDVAVKDLVTRFLGVLAPIPRVVNTIREQIERFAGLKRSQATGHEMGGLLEAAGNAFRSFYGIDQKPSLRRMGFDVLYSLVFGTEIELSQNTLDLVSNSVLVNNIHVSHGSMADTTFVPESTLFILREMLLTKLFPNGHKLLFHLQDFSYQTIKFLTQATSTGTHEAGRALEIMYPGWLKVRLNCALQRVHFNKTEINILTLLGAVGDQRGLVLGSKSYHESEHVKHMPVPIIQTVPMTRVSDSKTLLLLHQTRIPASKGDVVVIEDVPQEMSTVKEGYDETIFGRFPSKKNPVVLIPQTARGERYDALLMIHRNSLGPLIIAVDFKQSMEDYDFNSGTRFQLEWDYVHQQGNTTAYFERMKKQLGRKFDFVYLFITSKQVGPEHEEVHCFVVTGSGFF